METSSTNNIDKSKKEIIERLKVLRSSRNLSQANFAKLINVSPGNVGAWESGAALPSALALKNISQKFSCSIDWLLTGKTEKQIYTSNDPELERLQAILKKIMETDMETRIWAKKQFEYYFKPFIDQEDTFPKK